MIRILELRLSPQRAFDETHIRFRLRKALRIDDKTDFDFALLKRSVDARKNPPVYQLRFKVYIDGKRKEVPFKPAYPKVTGTRRVVITGAGPAGLFAALKLIEHNIKPVILERGKDVRSRRRDLVAITRFHTVNPDSNYCFGEGGAGTYSDGKLYTRSRKRGDVALFLKKLVYFGAPEDILIDAHPHIGTNKLPQLIENIRHTILACGGEIHFNTRVAGIQTGTGRIIAFKTAGSRRFTGEDFVLATGHSASDIYRMLYRSGIALEQKPFAMGVRLEHPQEFIDRMQYHCEIRNEHLPPASYTLVKKAGEKSVYSFCMCPGGVIAPCATKQEEIVTNGWSPSRRNNPFANAGIVVNVGPEDTCEFEKFGPLAGLYFRESIEYKAWLAGGKTQAAPAQRLTDFLKGNISATLPPCSYIPGIVPADLSAILPEFIVSALKKAFREWGKKMPGFVSEKAILVAVESRTSSPVRIPRDRETLHHIELSNLYPAGEGAGYAGGIVSAAIDGERIASKIAAAPVRD